MNVSAVAARNIGRHLAFGAFILIFAVVNAAALRQLYVLSRTDSTASHVVLIPFVTAALIYHRRQAIFHDVQMPGSRATGCAVIVAFVAWSACRYWAAAVPEDRLSASLAGLIVLSLAGFMVVYGATAFRAALFPLLFLAFTIPIPSVALDAATGILKRGSAEFVAGLFTVLGTPFHRQGFVFELPKFGIEIADECSGIRSSIALMLTVLLAGDVMLRSGVRKALLVLVVVPLAIAKNGIRIVTLSLLATYVNMGFITGALHHEGGIVFYLIALALLAPLVVWLRRSETINHASGSL